MGLLVWSSLLVNEIVVMARRRIGEERRRRRFAEAEDGDVNRGGCSCLSEGQKYARLLTLKF